MKEPVIDQTARVMRGAVLIGNVSLAAASSVWYNAVLRADGGAITLGRGSNLQDGCVLHAGEGHNVTIGEGVTVGHACIIHGCTLENGAFVGMGCTVMNGAVLEENAMLGAGSLVTEGTVIPAGTLAYGRPAKPVRPLTAQEIEINRSQSAHYQELAALPCQLPAD